MILTMTKFFVTYKQVEEDRPQNAHERDMNYCIYVTCERLNLVGV